MRAGNTLRDDLRRSERAIRDVGGRIFGLIVNAIEPNRGSYGYGYGSYGYNYSYSYSEKADT